ncbi:MULTISPECIES: outer membrane protein assembly factor BamD [Methylosinus]|uniref:Outer membrane protein assembly factor BamD n=1 Tax=Methylosinus sporium TaxID=428 RepID=A0A2U1SPP4_METSR|nr:MULTISPECIES: outer membrane protein assembly factor BamD [Methylosinus]MBU3889266.1 outer membrane protein assembly factor BamD [Methylosinus sp. KRF6]PWB93588.1 outer membrane protein assembly factor BamD [Methylosinus sporium]TRL30656.1 outer membrane protein assembly factor BamD [Methylosinus sporium]
MIASPFRPTDLARAALAAVLVAALPAAKGRADILDSITSGFGLFSGEKYKTEILPEIPAEDIYNQGLARMEKHDYENAAKKFGELEKQYPFSQWARKGLLMQTFAQYQKPAYDDAVASAQRYIGLYPTSPDTPYMYYLAGMSYYNQVPAVMQDQESAEKALAIFTQLVEKFPKSEYVTDVKYKIQVARDQLAAKDMMVGRFYLTRKNYPAAVNRFHDVLAKYQTTRHAEEALYRLTEAYFAMGVVNEAQTAAAILGHNFPDSSWYKDAHSLLATGGVAPEEHHGSWLSKIGKTLGSS